MIKKIDINDKSKVRIVYDVKPQNYTEEDKNNIIASFAKKYGLDKKQVEVAVNYMENSGNGEGVCINYSDINSIQDPKFQRELIKKYFDINGVTDYDPDKILEIDSQINSMVDFSKYDKKTTFNINYIDFDNFLSYGDGNYINFSGFKGLVLLKGNPANQSGKTTLCNDLIHFVLFGRSRSGKADSQAQMFNRFRPDKNTVNVKASITVDGQEYIIQRTLTRPEKGKKTKQIKNSVLYYKVLENGETEELEDYTENMTGESTVSTNKALKEAIGKEQDFDLMFSINASNLAEIIFLKDAERSRNMIRWFGLQSIEDKSVCAHEYWNKVVSANRYCGIYNRETLKDEIDAIKEQNKDIDKKIDKNNGLIEKTKGNIDKYRQEIDSLHASLMPIDKSFENIDYHTLVKEINGMNDSIGTIKDEIFLKKEEFSKYGEIYFSDEDYAGKMSRVTNLISSIEEIRATIKSLRSYNQQLKNSEYCPVCKRKLDGVDNTAFIKQNNDKVDNLIAKGVELNDEKTQLEKELKSMEEMRRKSEEKNKLDLLIAKKESTLSMLQAKLSEKNRIKSGIENNAAAIEGNGRIQASINVARTNYSNEERYMNSLVSENASFESEKASNGTKIANNASIIKAIEKEVYEEKHWKLYMAAIGKDGITKMILRESLPKINSQIKNMLSSSDIDFDVEIKMDEKNEILFLIKKGSVYAPLSSGSGYEQLVASLVIRTVINQFSAIPKPPFIILDEILGSVSSENLPKVRKLFENISHLYDFVFHITHLEEVVDWHDRVITVEKKDNVSSINVK